MCILSGLTVHNAFKSRKKICQNVFKIYQLGHFPSEKQMGPWSYSERGNIFFSSFVHSSFYDLKELVFNPNSKIVNQFAFASLNVLNRFLSLQLYLRDSIGCQVCRNNVSFTAKTQRLNLQDYRCDGVRGKCSTPKAFIPIYFGINPNTTQCFAPSLPGSTLAQFLLDTDVPLQQMRAAWGPQFSPEPGLENGGESPCSALSGCFQEFPFKAKATHNTNKTHQFW